jgi:hypothetical protein
MVGILIYLKIGTMNRIVEIYKAWKISFDPTREQAELAGYRMIICQDCPFKADEPMKYCTVCFCPLDKKVFSPKVGACPKGKWDITDKEYFKIK